MHVVRDRGRLRGRSRPAHRPAIAPGIASSRPGIPTADAIGPGGVSGRGGILGGAGNPGRRELTSIQRRIPLRAARGKERNAAGKACGASRPTWPPGSHPDPGAQKAIAAMTARESRLPGLRRQRRSRYSGGRTRRDPRPRIDALRVCLQQRTLRGIERAERGGHA